MENKKKIVHILRSTAVDPDPRAIKAARWLNELGYSVKVFGWDRECSSRSEESIEGIAIKRIRIRSRYGTGIKNILYLLIFNITLLFKLLRENTDIIHACDFDTVFPAIFLKKFRGKKLVYDIFDFYADSRRVGCLGSFFRKLEIWAVKQSDLIIIAHEERIKQLGPLPKFVKDKIITIYNTPERVEKSNESNNATPTPYFAYVGVLTPDRGLSFIVQAMEEMNNVGLTLAGFGPLEGELRKAAELKSNISFLGRISYDHALSIQQNALAIIALYDPSIPNNKYAAPNKLYEAAMLGKPIITSAGTLTADIVLKEQIGYVVPYGDVMALYKVYHEVINNPTKAELMGKRGRELYLKKYSANLMKKRLQNGYRIMVLNH